MKVSVVFDDPTVKIAGNHDAAALDLVAHMLGMATHDNENAVPANVAAREAPRFKLRRDIYPQLHLRPIGAVENILLAIDQQAQIQEAYDRAMEDLFSRTLLRIPQKNEVSRMFEKTYSQTG
jgi:hypothetical protein